MKHCDVIVVGAGLAGLQCARLLANCGCAVILIDRKPRIDQSIHTTGIFVRRTLEDFRIPEDCLGPAVRDVSLYSPARRRLDLSSPYDEFRVGRMGRLYQWMLEECLRAGVEWLPATRYAGHSVSDDRLIVRLDDKRQLLPVSAKYIVGADGSASNVAKDLQLDINSEWIVGVEDVWRDAGLDSSARLHCFMDPELAPGYLAWVAHDGEETHIGVGGYPSRFDPIKSLEKFGSSLNDIVDLRGAKKIERRGGRIPVGGVLRRIANQHGLLVGDAAGAVSPLTAGGLDPCMRLSTLAANLISEYLSTRQATVLATYNGTALRARFLTRLWMRRLVANMRGRAMLELTCGLLSLPALNSIAWHIFFGRGSFPDVQLVPTFEGAASTV